MKEISSASDLASSPIEILSLSRNTERNTAFTKPDNPLVHFFARFTDSLTAALSGTLSI